MWWFLCKVVFFVCIVIVYLVVLWHIKLKSLIFGRHPAIDYVYENFLRVDKETYHDGETISNSMDTKKHCNEDFLLKFKEMSGLQTCLPKHPQQTTHFSDLPTELVLYILKLVTCDGTENLEMLDQCAAVCRGWYLCARDPLLYHQACSKKWTEENSVQLDKYGGSWRRMLLERDRIYTSGCYVSSHNYQHFYYLRFYSDGNFIHFFSEQPPSTILPTLKKLKKAPFDNFIQTGQYKFINDELKLTFDMQPQWQACETCDFDHILRQLDIMIFDVLENKGKPCSFLLWKRFQKKSEKLDYSLPFHNFPPYLYNRII